MNPPTHNSTRCPYCHGTSIPSELVRAAIFSVLDVPYHTLMRLDALRQKICLRTNQADCHILDILQLALENGLDQMEMLEQVFTDTQNRQTDTNS